MRQVGLGLHLYDGDAGKLRNPNANATFDFNNQFAPDNPLEVIRRYVRAEEANIHMRLHVCCLI